MPDVHIPRLGIRTRLRGEGRHLLDRRHHLGIRRLARGRPHAYRGYLGLQLRRTLSKRDNDPGRGARLLIERVAAALPGPRPRVLCVGCRNSLELDRFGAQGVDDVVGIDLFSSDPRIRVMDMHALEFGDSRFDAVYASHSLEHAYDLEAVVAEIVRVARDGAVVAVEVPVCARAHEADRIAFSGLDALRDCFRVHVREELWGEEQPAWSESNEQGTEIARLVFRLHKVERHSVAPAPARPGRRSLAPPVRLIVSATIAASVLAWLAKAIMLNDYDAI